MIVKILTTVTVVGHLLSEVDAGRKQLIQLYGWVPAIAAVLACV